MTKEARIERLSLQLRGELLRNKMSKHMNVKDWRFIRNGLLDYYHAVNEEAIEISTKTGCLSGAHRNAMVRVMKRIGIKLKC